MMTWQVRHWRRLHPLPFRRALDLNRQPRGQVGAHGGRADARGFTMAKVRGHLNRLLSEALTHSARPPTASSAQSPLTACHTVCSSSGYWLTFYPETIEYMNVGRWVHDNVCHPDGPRKARGGGLYRPATNTTLLVHNLKNGKTTKLLPRATMRPE